MSVTEPKGFTAAGVACGVKASGDKDLALVATDDGAPVAAAAVFTANLATAAPVQVSRQHLQATQNRAAAVVLNSGNANAATGAAGREHAERMTALTAKELGCDPEHVLVCSTGLIGIPLPIDAVEQGIPALAAARTATAGQLAAEAIMTTDTHAKQTVVRGEGWTIGGMAKGAAMLAPNMATMLAVLTTDARVDAAELQRALQHAVDRSFNSLSVDGCTSTNDTVIVLANGRSDTVCEPIAFLDALTEACRDLAEQMAGDAEGATKVVRVKVVGATTDHEAAQAARKVAQSQLVKCSFYGQDPYWGRVVSELGTAGVAFDPDAVTIAYGGVVVCHNGVAAAHDEAAVQAHMAQRVIELTADLHLGPGEAQILTNDLTHAYIDENMGTS
ncbi:MAG TPA: bifunctional glutamate N-acetyltransferase/amino-acid acetyltransferase ArgJ [Acidimicrobiales bacterium]|nr:bifunctional glutamate N-acetyltransferase/amino-acid acetyltransferase ArgJ [Acidimicrobiales bacterium]